MKTIKNNWKVALIIAAGIVAVILLCVFGVQSSQNRAFALEEQVHTADVLRNLVGERISEPIYLERPRNRMEDFYQKELIEIKRKLDDKDIISRSIERRKRQ